jgi:hypothetical protein
MAEGKPTDDKSRRKNRDLKEIRDHLASLSVLNLSPSPTEIIRKEREKR